MTLDIKRLTEDEWEIGPDVRLAALQDAPYAFGSTYARERAFDEETWRSRLRNPDGPTFIAFIDGAPVGIDGAWTSDDGERVLVAMWVAPSARRRGVGAALTRAVIGWARARHASRITLNVAEGNAAAQELYESLGFQPTGNSEPLDSDPSRLTHEMVLDLRIDRGV